MRQALDAAFCFLLMFCACAKAEARNSHPKQPAAREIIENGKEE